MRFIQLGRKPDRGSSCRVGSNAKREEMLVTLSNPCTWDSIRSGSRRRRNCATYLASKIGIGQDLYDSFSCEMRYFLQSRVLYSKLNRAYLVDSTELSLSECHYRRVSTSFDAHGQSWQPPILHLVRGLQIGPHIGPIEGRPTFQLQRV